MDKSSRKRQWAGIGLAVGIFILTFVLWQIFGSPLVKFISDPEAMRAWVEKTGWASRQHHHHSPGAEIRQETGTGIFQ